MLAVSPGGASGAQILDCTMSDNRGNIVGRGNAQSHGHIDRVRVDVHHRAVEGVAGADLDRETPEQEIVKILETLSGDRARNAAELFLEPAEISDQLTALFGDFGASAPLAAGPCDKDGRGRRLLIA